MNQELKQYGPLRITIEGPFGPSGKTTVQLIIRDALMGHGFTVDCHDGEHTGPKDFEKRVGRFHAKETRSIGSLTPIKIDLHTCDKS